jgi:hypothetical protein
LPLATLSTTLETIVEALVNQQILVALVKGRSLYREGEDHGVPYQAREGILAGRYGVPQLQWAYRCTLRMNFTVEAGPRTVEDYDTRFDSSTIQTSTDTGKEGYLEDRQSSQRGRREKDSILLLVRGKVVVWYLARTVY